MLFLLIWLRVRASRRPSVRVGLVGLLRAYVFLIFAPLGDSVAWVGTDVGGRLTAVAGPSPGNSNDTVGVGMSSMKSRNAMGRFALARGMRSPSPSSSDVDIDRDRAGYGGGVGALASNVE